MSALRWTGESDDAGIGSSFAVHLHILDFIFQLSTFYEILNYEYALWKEEGSVCHLYDTATVQKIYF